jgi:hypothetical protein
VVAVGISLGGNALMRWAGEMGAEARQVVAGIASVCSPLDLTASGWAIGRGFNRQVYTRMFLKTMVPKALKKLEQHPGLFDRERLLAARDLYAFDNVFTAPVHGFKDADDYWSRASAKPHLHRIAVPALALNALNDPFVPASSLPQARDAGPPRHAVAAGRRAGTWAFPRRPFRAMCAPCPTSPVPGGAPLNWRSERMRAAQNSPMDDIVRQAIAKWPNVPDCYGWLGLDARGNWYMRDDRAQAAGPFAACPAPTPRATWRPRARCSSTTS